MYDGALRRVAHPIPSERVRADHRFRALEAVGAARVRDSESLRLHHPQVPDVGHPDVRAFPDRLRRDGRVFWPFAIAHPPFAVVGLAIFRVVAAANGTGAAVRRASQPCPDATGVL